MSQYNNEDTNMHISQAKQAAQFYRIPMVAHRALIADEQLGKGHALTLMLLASYLWSDEAVEGSRAEWSEALGIGAQTFEAHVPALGRAGCLSYNQPHVGYYRFCGLTRAEGEAEALRRAWEQAEAEFEHAGRPRRERMVWMTQRVEALKFTLEEALKFTLPVVDTTTTSSLNVLEKSAEQALKFTLDASENTLVEPEASKSTVDAGFAQVVQLYEQEIGGTLTAMMLDEFNELWSQCADRERWRYAFKASIGKRNRWAYVKAIIEHPERDRGGNNGRDADNRRGRAGARRADEGDGGSDGRNVAGTVSHDIDAWFGEL
jgi:hypothetical protein